MSATWSAYLAAIDAWRARPTPQTAGDVLVAYRAHCRELGLSEEAIRTLTSQHAINKTIGVAA